MAQASRAEAIGLEGTGVGWQPAEGPYGLAPLPQEGQAAGACAVQGPKPFWGRRGVLLPVSWVQRRPPPWDVGCDGNTGGERLWVPASSHVAPSLIWAGPHWSAGPSTTHEQEVLTPVTPGSSLLPPQAAGLPPWPGGWGRGLFPLWGSLPWIWGASGGEGSELSTWPAEGGVPLPPSGGRVSLESPAGGRGWAELPPEASGYLCSGWGLALIVFGLK